MGRLDHLPPWAYSAEVAFGYEGWKGEVETAGNRPGVEGGGDMEIPPHPAPGTQGTTFPALNSDQPG